MQSNNHEHTNHDHNQPTPGFLSELEIEKTFPQFTGQKAPNPHISEWFSNRTHDDLLHDHMELVPGSNLNCDELSKEWIKWIHQVPTIVNPIAQPGTAYGDAYAKVSNPFLFNNKGVKVYFTTASPFKGPDIRRIIMTEKVPLLVGIYTISAAKEEFPSLDQAGLKKLIMNDLSGLNPTNVKLNFDGKEVHGCTVMLTEQFFTIENIPDDNVMGIPTERLGPNHSINVLYGGLFALFKASNFSAGEHLLTFEANSINYEMAGKINISAQV